MSKILSKTTMRGPHFTVPVLELLAALETLKLGIARRAFTPVLRGVLVRHGVNGLLLSTFDYETAVTVALDPESQPDFGRMLVPFEELERLVKAGVKGESKKDQESMVVQVESTITRGRHIIEKSVPGKGQRENVEEDFESAEVTVTVGGFTMPIESLPVEDYPKLPEVRAADAVIVAEAEELHAAWTRVQVAAGHDDTLPMLTHQRWEIFDGILSMAATDRFQLMQVRTKVEQVRDGMGLMMPPVTGKVLKTLTGQMQVLVTGHFVGLFTRRVRIVVQDGQYEFPRVRQLWPSRDKMVVVNLDRAALLKVLTKASAMVSSRVKAVALEVQEGSLTVVPWSERQERVKGAQIAATASAAVRWGVDPDKLHELLTVFPDGIALAISQKNGGLSVVAPDEGALFDYDAPARGLVMGCRLAE